MREDPFLHADDEHHPELQALRVVQGHQRDHAVLVAQGVDVGVEADLLEELAQRALRVVAVVLLCDAHELLQVLQPPLGLDGTLVAQRRPADRSPPARPAPARPPARPLGAVRSPSRGASPPTVRQGALRPSVERRCCDPAQALRGGSRAGRDLVQHGRRAPAQSDALSPAANCCRRPWATSPKPRFGVLTMRGRRKVVGRVHHAPQVGQHVLDLGPLVEPGAADHLVGHAVAHQDVLQHPGLGVHPVEDGDLAGRTARPQQRSRSRPPPGGPPRARRGTPGAPPARPGPGRSTGAWACDPRLWATTALAASRMVVVER